MVHNVSIEAFPRVRNGIEMAVAATVVLIAFPSFPLNQGESDRISQSSIRLTDATSIAFDAPLTWVVAILKHLRLFLSTDFGDRAMLTAMKSLVQVSCVQVTNVVSDSIEMTSEHLDHEFNGLGIAWLTSKLNPRFRKGKIMNGHAWQHYADTFADYRLNNAATPTADEETAPDEIPKDSTDHADFEFNWTKAWDEKLRWKNWTCPIAPQLVGVYNCVVRARILNFVVTSPGFIGVLV